jgi:hypothetical protein
MKQGEFRDIMIMSKNEIAMPRDEAVKREFAVNEARLLQRGDKRIAGRDRDLLVKRQEQLLREMARC